MSDEAKSKVTKPKAVKAKKEPAPTSAAGNLGVAAGPSLPGPSGSAATAPSDAASECGRVPMSEDTEASDESLPSTLAEFEAENESAAAPSAAPVMGDTTTVAAVVVKEEPVEEGSALAATPPANGDVATSAAVVVKEEPVEKPAPDTAVVEAGPAVVIKEEPVEDQVIDTAVVQAACAAEPAGASSVVARGASLPGCSVV